MYFSDGNKKSLKFIKDFFTKILNMWRVCTVLIEVIFIYIYVSTYFIADFPGA